MKFQLFLESIKTQDNHEIVNTIQDAYNLTHPKKLGNLLTNSISNNNIALNESILSKTVGPILLALTTAFSSGNDPSIQLAKFKSVIENYAKDYGTDNNVYEAISKANQTIESNYSGNDAENIKKELLKFSDVLTKKYGYGKETKTDGEYNIKASRPKTSISDAMEELNKFTNIPIDEMDTIEIIVPNKQNNITYYVATPINISDSAKKTIKRNVMNEWSRRLHQM